MRRIRFFITLGALLLCFIPLWSAVSKDNTLQQTNPPPGYPCGFPDTRATPAPDWATWCGQTDPKFPEAQSCVCSLANQCAAFCKPDDPDCASEPFRGCFGADQAAIVIDQFNTCLEGACNSCCVRNNYRDGKVVILEHPDTTFTLCDCGPANLAAPPAASQAMIQLQPEQGAPGSEVEVTGEGFPANTDVEVRWDGVDGQLAGEGRSDANGRIRVLIQVPIDAEEGEYPVVAVYSDASGKKSTSASFMVRLLCISGQVSLKLRGGLPLPGVEVSLWWSDPTQAFNPLLVRDVIVNRNWVAADAQGKYRICSPLIGIPSRDWLLQVRLLEVQTGAYTLIDQPLNEFSQAFFGKGGAIGAVFNDVDTWFTIADESDLRKDLVFEDLEDKAETADVREDHALDAALIYYHLNQAWQVYQKLNVRLAATPAPVYIFSPDPTSAGGAGITFFEGDSEWNDGNAPKNREWHEFSHYVMWSVYGSRFPPMHQEQSGIGIAGDINGNHIIDFDTNHGAYLLNALSSSDAVVEGFAEFMALVIADQMNQAGEPYMQDLLAPFIYTLADGGPFPEMLNFEINYHQNVIPSLPADQRKQTYDLYKSWQDRSLYQDLVPGEENLPNLVARGDEENCVASLLWDLYDPVDPADQDGMQVPLERLWAILSGGYTFPKYYPGTVITQFTGDADTYAGQFEYYNLEQKLGAFTGVRNRNEPFPTEVRHIYYIKDLYDALALSLPDQKTLIDQVFASHAVYVDSFRILEDYHAVKSGSIQTFADVGSKVSVSVSARAAYQFWSQGVVAEVEATGWGAGLIVPQDQAFDARGYLYLWTWLNLPTGTNFYLVVEDDAGQWLCAGTSEAFYELSDPLSDITYFQHGTGSWNAYAPPGMTGGPYPYVAVLGPSSAGETEKQVYDWRPNPYHKTPPAGASGPNIASLRGVGVLFTTPGSYQALVGASVVTADYPWKPGMRSIKGLGDSALGIYSPYRRDHPVVPGSKTLIQLNSAPAILQVTLTYGAPYEGLSFTYPLTITQKTQEIWLYIEPAFDGVENTIQIAAQQPGKSPGKAIEIRNTIYWEQIGVDRYVWHATLSTRPVLGTLPWLIGGLAGVLVIGIGVIVFINAQRRRRAALEAAEDWQITDNIE